MAVQAGFVAGTLLGAFVNLADVVSTPRKLVCASARSPARSPTRRCCSRPVAWRRHRCCASLTGVALASVYPPGMKMAAGWFRERTRLRAWPLDRRADAGQGISAPADHALRRRLAPADAAGVRAGGARRHAGPRRRPRRSVRGADRAASIRTPSAGFSRFAARGSRRSAISATCGSSTRCGRGSAVFATASFTAAGLGPAASKAGSLAAFLAIGSGTAGCALAGYCSDRSREGARRHLGAGGQRHLRGAHRRRLRPARRSGSSRW